jgi:hypothetical protein
VATKQKNQHLIPRCYLANFVSDDVPAEHRSNPQFERGVWTTGPTLDEDWKLQGIGNLLSRSYAYELPGDTPHAQKIESFLSAVESPWPGIVRTLSSRQALNADQEIQLRFFIATLFHRTDAVMDMIQGMSNEIELLYRSVERASMGAETAADELFRDTQHLSKMLIKDSRFGAVIQGLRIYFLCNDTPACFLSSDAPVCLRHLHSDEVARLLPPTYVKSSVPTNVRRPLMLCPLAPGLMLLACEFLSDNHADSPFITITDRQQSTLLNILTIANARDLLLSSLRDPFGQNQPAMAAILRTGSCGGRDRGTWMLLYTSEHRYWLPLERYEHNVQTIEFMTPALDTLQQAVDDEALVSAEIFVDGQSRAGIQEILFEDVDVSGKRPTRIGARVKLPIGK